MSQEQLTKDFELKRKTYHYNNYIVKTRANYLRRARNRLIYQNIADTQHCDNVLDVGCGPAILYEQLLSKSGKYYALDVVKSNLEEIKNNTPNHNIELLQDDIDSFEWENDFFDIIICSGSLEYSQNPEANILRFFRYLKPGGILVCSLPNKLSPYRLWGEYVYKYIWRIKNLVMGKPNNHYPRKLFTKNNITNLVNNSLSVESTKIQYLGLKLLLQPYDKIFENLDFKIIKYFENKESCFLDRFSQEMLVTIKKQC